MSFAEGLAALQGEAACKSRELARPNAQMGTFIWSPGNIKAYIDQTSADITATWRDVNTWEATLDTYAKKQPYLAMLAGWTDFLGKWAAYKDDASTWTGGTVDRVNEYRIRHKQWRDTFRSAGVKFTTPEPMPPEGSISSDSTVKKLLIGAAVGVTTYLVVETYKAWKR